MRDKGLVFDELRRQRRHWTPALKEASLAWLLGLAALLVFAGVLQMHRVASRNEAHGHPSTGMAGHDWSPDGQPGGGRHAAKSR